MPEMPLVPLIDGWETVAEMEAALGIPQGNLVATLDRYNTYAARGEDPDFHKQPEFLAPQDNGPWGAFDLSLGKAMYAGFTVGGLATSVDGQVLRDDGTVVARPLRGGGVRVQHRPGRQGLCQRHAARARGRSSAAAPERTRRRPAARKQRQTLRRLLLRPRPSRHWPPPEQMELLFVVLLDGVADG